MILKNRIRCRFCGDIVESKYRHDFKSCSCGRVVVDGGRDYLRRGYIDSKDDYIELSVFAPDKEMTVRELIEKNRSDPRHRYTEYAVRDAGTGRVLWDGDRRRPLPDEIGAREIVSWQVEPDPQDGEAIIIWIDVFE